MGEKSSHGKSLEKALKEIESGIKYIDLSWKQIGDIGAASIAEALKVNSSVTDLFLDDNQISDIGAASLGEALKVNSSVIRLHLGGNQIGNIGAASLGEALKDNSSLQHLLLYRNPLGINGILALANGVKYGSTALRHIYVGSLYAVDQLAVSNDLYVIGEGKFGKALRGSLHPPGRVRKMDAVFKIPHEKSSTDSLYETLILQALPEHKNVVKPFGCCPQLDVEETEEKGKLKQIAFSVKTVTAALVVQLHQNGSLKSYVERRPVRDLKPFLGFALGMSESIKHLHSYNILHRDIASRNFVLSDDYDPILIDFGLSCYIKEGHSVGYERGEICPFRQSAPETLYSRQSWKASDVWMLGVTFWQMLGIDEGIPFINHETPKTLREHLKKRYVSNQFEFPLFYQHDVCTEIKEFITFCCHFQYLKRPTIEAVIEKIQAMQANAENGDGISADKYFEENEAKDGDLSVYGGSDYPPEEYHSLEGDGNEGTIEEYYSIFSEADQNQDRRFIDYDNNMIGEENDGVVIILVEGEEKRDADNDVGYDLIPAVDEVEATVATVDE